MNRLPTEDYACGMTLRFPRAKFIFKQEEDQLNKLQTAFSLESELLAQVNASGRKKAHVFLPPIQLSGISQKRTNA